MTAGAQHSMMFIANLPLMMSCCVRAGFCHLQCQLKFCLVRKFVASMAAFRHASLLLAILTVLSCFLPAFVGAPFRSTPSRLGLRPMGSTGRRASLTNPDFFWGNGFEEQDLEEAAQKLSQSTSSELWDKATFPPEDRWGWGLGGIGGWDTCPFNSKLQEKCDWI